MKYLVFDMYGVIIEESQGNLTSFVYLHFPNLDKKYFRDLYIKASIGVINSDEFFDTLGFNDPEAAKYEYIEKHLTLDKGFIPFANQFFDKYKYALLSNDVQAWSEYIRFYYNIDKYFKHAVTSANTGYRKPDKEIFKIALERLETIPENCIFIDNSVQNRITARKVGMDTVLFNRDGKKYDGKVINSFEELAAII